MEKLIDVQVNLEGLSETGNRLIEAIRDVGGDGPWAASDRKIRRSAVES